MAKRPWVIPSEVKTYSEHAYIQQRSEVKVKTDIMRAEMYIISYTNNKFEDDEKYPEVPAEVKTAVILCAEVYGNSAREGKGEYKSESFDDYSYTAAEIEEKLKNLDLGPLLDDYTIKEPSNAVSMRLRKL